MAVPGEQTTLYSHFRNSLGCFYEESDATRCRETAKRNGNMQQSAWYFRPGKDRPETTCSACRQHGFSRCRPMPSQYTVYQNLIKYKTLPCFLKKVQQAYIFGPRNQLGPDRKNLPAEESCIREDHLPDQPALSRPGSIPFDRGYCSFFISVIRSLSGCPLGALAIGLMVSSSSQTLIAPALSFLSNIKTTPLLNLGCSWFGDSAIA